MYWFVHRAYHNCRQAQILFNTFNYVESIIASFEAIEFAVKAMCKICDVNYEPKHFTKDAAETMSRLAEKVSKSNIFSKEKILQTVPIIMSYNEKLRIISRYGLEKENIPTVAPPKIFGRDYSESVMRDAKSLCEILRKMERKIRWGL